MRRTALPVLLAALAYAPEVHAAPDVPLRYSTDGDPSCPPAEHVEAEIAMRLAADAPMPESVAIDVRREGGQHVATVTIRRAGQSEVTRVSIASGPCSCLAAAVHAASKVAFALSPFGVCPAPEECPTCPPCPTRPTAPPPAAPATCPATAEEEEERAVEAGAALLVSAGLGPVPALGLSTFLRARWEHASIGLGALGLLPSEGTGEHGEPVALGMLAGGAIPCLHAGAFTGCGLLHVGAVIHDSERARSPTATVLLALGLRAGAEIPLGSGLALDIHAGVATVATPPVTHLNGRRVWAASLTGTVALGVVVRLGPL